MRPSSSAPSKYRPDIDGLRAIAVLAVVAYHAGFPGFSGGFVGVDVFFVISGFLITRLLLNESAQFGRISFLGFYARRMRRLLPALAVVILAAVALNVFLVPGFVDVRKFSASIPWSAFGFGNVFFLRNTGGYFDGVAEEMPLLHLWSLGVEEQFYLCWPLLLTICQSKRVLAALGLLSVVSFLAACDVIHLGRAPEAFYLMPYRAWELGLGAMLACGPGLIGKARGKFWDTIAAAIGLILIGVSVVTYSTKTGFPGAAALLPVLGTALLIWAGNSKNPISSALSVKPLVRVGLLSYGWYLWHWPLLVTARLWNMGAVPSWVTRFLLLALSLVLAEISLRWIETPIRRGKPLRDLPSSAVVVGGLAASAGIALMSFQITRWQDSVLSKRVGPDLVRQVREVTRFSGMCFGVDEIGAEKCRVSFAKASPAGMLAIWGDSHACSYFPMLEDFARMKGLELTQYCQPETPPLVESGNSREVFQDLRRKVLARSPAPVSVVLVSRWVSYTGKRLSALDPGGFPSFGNEKESLSALKLRLAKTYLALKSIGVSRVLVLLPYPEFKSQTLRCLIRGAEDSCATPRLAVEDYRRSVVQAIRQASARFDYVHLIDPVAAVCERETCPQVFRGIPVVVDTNHPSVHAAQHIGSYYSGELDWAMLR